MDEKWKRPLFGKLLEFEYMEPEKGMVEVWQDEANDLFKERFPEIEKYFKEYYEQYYIAAFTHGEFGPCECEWCDIIRKDEEDEKNGIQSDS